MILKPYNTNYITKCWRNYCSSGQPIKMAYTVYNEGKKKSKSPLLIMHGLFGSRQNWSTVCRALEKKSKQSIIALDARNHGESPHTSELSPQLIALDIMELMKDMNINKTFLLGHSMGGRIMMYMALKYPQYVQGAVIVDVSPISVPKDLREGRKLAEKELLKFVERKKNVDFILLNLKRTPDGLFTWTCNVEALYNNLQKFVDFMDDIAGLQPYTGPMMFICGKRSRYVDPNSWPDIQKLFPNAEIHWLDAGHLIHLEQPTIFVDLVINFLGK